jgi:hypothetical protein
MRLLSYLLFFVCFVFYSCAKEEETIVEDDSTYRSYIVAGDSTVPFHAKCNSCIDWYHNDSGSHFFYFHSEGYVDLDDDNDFDLIIRKNGTSSKNHTNSEWIISALNSTQVSYSDEYEDYVSETYPLYFTNPINDTMNIIFPEDFFGKWINMYENEDVIDQNNDWINGDCFVKLHSRYCCFDVGPEYDFGLSSESDKYIGIRKILSNDTIYAWLDLNNGVLVTSEEP